MTIHLPPIGPDLPVHPYTGLTAIGLRRSGAPIWPVKGGAPEEDDADDGDKDDDADDDKDDDDKDDDDKELRPQGKRALDRMRGQRNKARTDLKPWSDLARELGVKTPDDVKALLQRKGKPKTGSDDDGDQVDADEIRRQARAEVEQETLRDRVLDKIEAKAHKFADPADAAALLLREGDLDDFLDGRKIDTESISEALDELLKRKPYLGRSRNDDDRDSTRRRPRPDRSQGKRSGGAVTGKEAGIAEAEKRFGKPKAG